MCLPSCYKEFVVMLFSVNEPCQKAWAEMVKCKGVDKGRGWVVSACMVATSDENKILPLIELEPQMRVQSMLFCLQWEEVVPEKKNGHWLSIQLVNYKEQFYL